MLLYLLLSLAFTLGWLLGVLLSTRRPKEPTVGACEAAYRCGLQDGEEAYRLRVEAEVHALERMAR